MDVVAGLKDRDEVDALENPSVGVRLTPPELDRGEAHDYSTGCGRGTSLAGVLHTNRSGGEGNRRDRDAAVGEPVNDITCVDDVGTAALVEGGRVTVVREQGVGRSVGTEGAVDHRDGGSSSIGYVACRSTIAYDVTDIGTRDEGDALDRTTDGELESITVSTRVRVHGCDDDRGHRSGTEATRSGDADIAYQRDRNGCSTELIEPAIEVEDLGVRDRTRQEQVGVTRRSDLLEHPLSDTTPSSIELAVDASRTPGLSPFDEEVEVGLTRSGCV